MNNIYAAKKKYQVNALSNKWNVIFNIILTVFSLICVLPVVLVYIVSFTSEESIAQYGYRFIPRELSIGAYEYLFKTGEQIANSYMVSIIVTVVGSLLSVLVMSMFAYTLSRKDFKYRNVFSFLTFFTMLFSGGLVPSYIINATVLRLNDTIFALILPYTVNAFYVIVLRTFYTTTIPDSIIESAKIDGAGELTTFLRIVFPLSKPGLATVGLFSVIGYWNDWFLGLLYITKPRLVSIQYMLMKIQNSLEFIKQNSAFANSADGVQLALNTPSESGRMALTVVVMTPILFAYPFFQKYFVKGLTLGSVKG